MSIRVLDFTDTRALSARFERGRHVLGADVRGFAIATSFSRLLVRVGVAIVRRETPSTDEEGWRPEAAAKRDGFVYIADVVPF